MEYFWKSTFYGLKSGLMALISSIVLSLHAKQYFGQSAQSELSDISDFKPAGHYEQYALS